MTYRNGSEVKFVVSWYDSELGTEFIYTFLYLGAVLSIPYPGVTSYEGTSESSKERPEESVSDAVFCYLVSNMDNGLRETYIPLPNYTRLHEVSFMEILWILKPVY